MKKTNPVFYLPNLYSVIYTLLICVLMGSPSLWAQVPLGLGSYNPNGSGPPAGEGPKTTSNFTKKVITTDWWTSLIWSKWQNPAGYSNIMHPHPFSYRCQANGLGIGYDNTYRIYNGNAGTSFNNNYDYPYSEDLSVGLENTTFTGTNVEDYSDWDVLANWTSNGNILRARMGHGFTYTYFTKVSANAVLIKSIGNIVVSGNTLRITVTGQSNTKKYFAVFAPTGAIWQGSGGSYTSLLNGKDYWSVALLPDGSDATFNAFFKNAFAFVGKTTMSYSYDKPNSKIKTDFNVSYDNKEGAASTTFFALYRHQWLHTADVNTSYRYACPRDSMKVVSKPGFSTLMNNIGALPLIPKTNGFDKTKMQQLVTDFANRPVYNCQGMGCTGGYYGSYTMGRYMAQAGQVALIAHQIGDVNSRNKIVNWIKSELEDYFQYTNDIRHIAYNSKWNATYNSSDNIEHCAVECLNDKNLTYGYWVRAAAIVAQFNKGWADSTKWGKMVELLIRDVANTNRADNMFPFMRNFDVYAGHSWALGFSDVPEGADQESSSESINFASALIYYGQVTGRKDLEERGMWMYTTEVVASEQYWFDVEQKVFPPAFPPKMLGIVRSSAGMYQLWWQLLPEHVLMVNSFPWTGGSLYLGRYPDACKRVYEWIATGAGQNGIQKYQGYLWPYLALYDPTKALNEYASIPYDYSVELEAEANNYYWLNAMKTLGNVDKTITANTQSFVVFNQGGIKSYAVYNPPGRGIQYVDFSDGLHFKCPADTLIVFHASDAIPVVTKTERPEQASMVVNLYPNPTDGILNVTFENQFTELKAEFYDVIGNKIMVKKLTEQHAEINLKGMKPGIYYLKLNNEHFQKIYKVSVTE
jgi:endoglucanase Acf2